MRPYKTMRLEEFHDIGDIQSKARAKGIRTLAKRKGISMKEARFQKALAISSHYARKKS